MHCVHCVQCVHFVQFVQFVRFARCYAFVILLQLQYGFHYLLWVCIQGMLCLQCHDAMISQ